jgi:hypothetical protein
MTQADRTTQDVTLGATTQDSTRDETGGVARSLARMPFFHPLAHFAATCFIGTLATDLAFWRTADWFWADISDWRVTASR